MNGEQPNVPEIIALYYEAFNQGDRAGMLRLLHPGVVHDINQGGSETGVEAFAAFLTHMDDCYEEQVEELAIMVNGDGSRASAEFFIRGKYLKSDEGLPPAAGQTYHLRVGAFFELVEGRISRVTNYYNLADWLRQVSGS